MRAQSFLLPVLVLVFAVPLLCQKTAPERATDTRLLCTITAQNGVWQMLDSTQMTVAIENISDQDIQVDRSATLVLSASFSKDAGLGSYWAPIDIKKGSPAETYEDPPGTIFLRHPKVTVPKHSTVTFNVHAANVNWDARISSTWPARRLFAVAFEGEYTLQLITASDKGEIRSNVVTVTIRKVSPGIGHS